MSYLVLARKYRPKNFTEVVGQEHVLNSLIHSLDQDRLHHAYLFSGTRGVGKTTLARLLSKSVNCEKGVSSHPCGHCQNCIAIDEGRFVDLIEIDAASRTKVEDTRDILDNVQYMPIQGRYKVYLIDEVHMLSQHSFNALLKTLEEPPEHVKFLLATTDPHKLPITILSRCLQFNLKHITEPKIEGKLASILQDEHILFELPALTAIAHSADGSMRDALSLTDQAISFSGGRLITSDVQAMLGLIDKQMIDTLIAHILAEDTQALVAYSNEIIMAGRAPLSVLNGLSECFYYASLSHFNDSNTHNLICSDEALKAIVKKYTPEQIQLYYQLSIKAKEDIHLAPTAQCGLGMALLRLCAFKLDFSNLSTIQKNHNPALKKPDSNQQKLQLLKTTFGQDQDSLQKKTVLKKQSGAKITPHTKPIIEKSPDIQQGAIKKTTQPQQNTVDWYQLSQTLALKGSALQIALHSSLEKIENNIYTLQALDMIKSIITPNSIQQIEKALSLSQRTEIKVKFQHLNKIEFEHPLKKNNPENTTTQRPEIQLNLYSDEVEPEKGGKHTPPVNDFSSQNIDFNMIQENNFTSNKTGKHITPAQINQQQKKDIIQSTYETLQKSDDMQALAELGFELKKENITLQKL